VLRIVRPEQHDTDPVPVSGARGKCAATKMEPHYNYHAAGQLWSS
jgi:hypothetical protein